MSENCCCDASVCHRNMIYIVRKCGSMYAQAEALLYKIKNERKISMRSYLQKRIVSLLAVLTLLAAMLVPAVATDATSPVTADRDGVFLVRMVINDAQKGIQNLEVSTGSGFLINESTIVTCYHVTHFILPDDEEVVEDWMELLGYNSYNDFEKHLSVQVVYQADLYMDATELTGSEMIDFSVLALSQPISNHTCLTLREEPVQDLETVYALGFPYTVSAVESTTAHSYTASDVTVTDAKVSKAAATVGGVEFIQHNALIAGGNSGGPLVDENGYVVGVNRMVDNQTESFGWAISISQVIQALNTNSIVYNLAGEIAPVESNETDQTEANDEAEVRPEVDTSALDAAIVEAESVQNEADKYTDESMEALAKALVTAKTAQESTDQSVVDQATQDIRNAITNKAEKSVNIVPIVIIVVAAVLVIVIVIVVVVMTRKKKPVTAVGPAADPVTVGGGFAPATPVTPNDYTGGNTGGGTMTDVLAGGNSTTVLNDAPNTTVLNKPAFASLTRVATGEKVDISSAEFVIGRERNANFYVTNNTAIGRRHAKIVNQSGQISLVDMASTNGTFVNGAKASANVPIMLKDGDKIMLADETFTISIF